MGNMTEMTENGARTIVHPHGVTHILYKATKDTEEQFVLREGNPDSLKFSPSAAPSIHSPVSARSKSHNVLSATCLPVRILPLPQAAGNSTSIYGPLPTLNVEVRSL